MAIQIQGKVVRLPDGSEAGPYEIVSGLSPAQEAALIQGGDAVAAGARGLVPAFYDVSGASPVLLDPNGNPASVSGAWNRPNLPSEYPVHSARVSGALIQLDLPSPYYPATANTKEHAYGTPLYFENGFKGYRWVMMAAPYPTLASNLGGVSPNKFENPTVYVTNDPEGIVGWVQPPGVSGAVFDSRSVAENGGASYYADPHLSASADGNTLYLLWHWFNRSSGSVKHSILISATTDLVNWTTPVSIYDGTLTTFKPNSCSLICNGTGLGWTVVGVDTRDDTGTFTIQRMTTASADPTTGWGAWTTATAVNPNSRNWWHMHCVGLSGGVIVGMAADNSSAGGQAYTMRSDDNGLTWSCHPFSYVNLGSAAGSWYRPSLCLVTKAGVVEARMYVTRLNPVQQLGFWIQTAKLRTDAVQVATVRASQRDMVARKVTSAELKRSALAWDSFIRADNASLGNLDSGQAWVNPATGWKILSNKAQVTDTTNQIQVVDVGRTSYEIDIRMDTFGTQFQLIWGYVNNLNFFRYGSSGIQTVVAGAVGTSYTNPSGLAYSSFASGTWFQLIKDGPYHTILIDDRIVDSFYDTSFPGATRVGFQASGASATILSGFIVRPVL